MKKQITNTHFYKKVERLIVILGCLGIILGIFVVVLNSSLSGDSKWYYWLIALLFIFGAIAGVISVVASNEKNPIKLLVLSIIATIFKLIYPIMQMISQNEIVNSTVFFGQTFSIIFLFLQVYLWIKWNKQSKSGKFLTKHFKGYQRYYFVIFVLFLFLGALLFSRFVINNPWLWAFIDVLGGISFMLGNWLMVFGNIYCFFFFFISDLTWIGWTIADFSNSNNLVMQLLAFATLVEVLSYTGLAVTGYFAWKDEKSFFNFRSTEGITYAK